MADWPQDFSLNYRLERQLRELKQTSEANRWPNAVWPSEKAFEDAFVFINCLPSSLIPMPDINLADDGEINFLWKTDDVHVDLGFYGTGTLSFFAKKENERKIYGEHVPVTEGLPHDIGRLLWL